MTMNDEEHVLNDIEAVAPEFAKLTKDLLFDDMWNRPGLSHRDKSLITVTCLVALNRLEQMEFHLHKALKNGLSKEELVATLTHIAFYAGWPAASSGCTHFRNVLERLESQSPSQGGEK